MATAWMELGRVGGLYRLMQSALLTGHPIVISGHPSARNGVPDH